MSHMKGIIGLGTLTLMAMLFLLTTPVMCKAGIIFNENFNNKNLPQWDVNQNGYPIPVSVSNGFINVGSPGTTSLDFPYIRCKTNPFPSSGDYTLEIGFQYTSYAGNGAGLFGSGDYVTFWGDTRGLMIDNIGNLGFDYNYHVLEYSVNGSNVSTFLDGVLRNTTSMTIRPTDLWFGHATLGQEWFIDPTNHPAPYLDSNGVVTQRWWLGGDWTTFKLDYIQIDSVKKVPEPNSAFLLGIGISLLGLLSARIRFKKN